MWIYAVTAEAVKILFMLLGILMVVAILYIIYKLLAHCCSTREIPSKVNNTHIYDSFKDDFEKPFNEHDFDIPRQSRVSFADGS